MMPERTRLILHHLSPAQVSSAHFPDIYALLDYSISRMFMQMIEKRILNVCSYSPDNLRNLILAMSKFLANIHCECAQLHQQFESLTEGTIKNILFELLSFWLKQTGSKISTDIPATVATWAIHGLASHYSHMKKQSTLHKFVDEALLLVAVNLEQFAQTA